AASRPGPGPACQCATPAVPGCGRRRKRPLFPGAQRTGVPQGPYAPEERRFFAVVSSSFAEESVELVALALAGQERVARPGRPGLDVWLEAGITGQHQQGLPR